ncbi:MAG TPA: flagellar biosynthesis anti-sigma factor FlgM [Solirubrobacter sp.]|nr:flagellar biosynthesis anti-sigma factor FlgM [Solirubrobacter sp.]
MTALEVRYQSPEQVTERARRFARAPKDGAVTKVQDLRERVEGGTYEVDSQAVAAAILKRLLEGGLQ